MRLIANGKIEHDRWALALDETEPVSAHAVLPLARWQSASRAGELSWFGLLVRADDNHAAVIAALPRCPLVAIEFASFTDGRGYSLARMVRTNGYAGDLRAVGELLRDQAFFLARCGFSSLAPAAHVDLDDFVRGLSDFTEVYQPAADERMPISRQRRAR